MAPATAEAWVPATNEELRAFQRKLTGHLVRRRPNFPRAILDSEIVPDAWAVGYAEYLEMVADPEIEEIKDPEALLLSICVNEGEHLIRSSTRRDARFEIKPTSMVDTDSELVGGQTIEDFAAKDQAIIEKYSPVAAAVKNDQRNVMLSAMAELPPGQLEAFRRVILLDQSQVDAAREIGIGIRPFEKRLKKAVSQVAWALTQTSDHSLCDKFNEITADMPDPSNPNRAQQTEILKHVQSCSDCKKAIFESPFGLDGLGVMLTTGAFGTTQAPSIGERISSLPIVEGPVDAAKSAWDKIWPGSHGAEAAIGGGTAAGGAGGTALAIGGGKALVTLCAGVATTACVAGVATGVIPITQSNAEKNRNDNKPAATKTADQGNTVAVTDSRANYETTRAKIESTIQKRQARRAKAKAQAVAERKAAAAAAAAAKKDTDQVSYTSPATSSPTTQAETNASAMAASTGIPTAPSGGGGSSSSSSGGSSGGSSSAQTQTNQQAANDSFGFGN